MAAHSELGASGASRWMNCPGSIRLSQGIPNTSSSYAKEGTAAHELGEQCLLLDTDAVGFLGNEIKVEGEKFTVDEDMVEAVQVYLDTVRADYEVGDILGVEEKFDLSEIYPGMFGTNDSMLYKPRTRQLKVFDYKHGRGVAVEAENNKQLKYYGIGALLKLGKPCVEIELIIVQPRAYHLDGPIRRWTTTPADLLDFAGELEDAGRATEAPDAPVIPGDHCQFCRASGVCPAQANKALAVAQTEFSAVQNDTVDLPDPDLLTNDELARILDGADMLEGWLKAVRAKAHNKVELGEDIPGYRLVAKQARRSWIKDDDEEVISELCAAFGLQENECYAPAKVRSPAQIEKLLKKADKKRLEDFWEKKSSGANLVRESSKDSRPAVAPKAAREFSAVTDQTAPADSPALSLF